jgi:hypothetical protein
MKRQPFLCNGRPCMAVAIAIAVAISVAITDSVAVAIDVAVAIAHFPCRKKFYGRFAKGAARRSTYKSKVQGL